MVDNEEYGDLMGLIRSRFHEDFDLFGNSVEELHERRHMVEKTFVF